MASTAVDLIREKGAALPASALERFQAEQLAVLWEMHARGCSLQEFAVLLSLAEKYDLDINAHEIWAAKGRGRDGEPGKLMILVGRDGLLTIARRQADHVTGFVTIDGDVHRKNDLFKVTRLPDGTRTVEHSYEGSVEERGEIVGSWAMVKRRDGSFTNYTYCPLSEYLPSYNGWQKSPWGKQISAMIQKVSVSLALRIAYGISGVVGEDEVSYQFQEPPAADGLSLAAAVADVPDDLQQRLYDAYGEAADLRSVSLSPAVVQMSVKGQARERVEAFIEEVERANAEARAAAQDEAVEDAEVVSDDEPPLDDTQDRTRENPSPTGAASARGASGPGAAVDLDQQVADLYELRREVEEQPGDLAETEAELDRIGQEIERLERERDEELERETGIR